MAAKLMSNTPTIATDFHESVESYRQLITSTGEDLERPGLQDTPQYARQKRLRIWTQGYHQSLEEVSMARYFHRPIVNWSWCKTLNFIHYVSIICCHFMASRTSVTRLSSIRAVKVRPYRRYVCPSLANSREFKRTSGTNDGGCDRLPRCGSGYGCVAHMCMMMRGVNKQHSTTRSTAMLGEYVHDNQARNEFLDAVPKRKPAF